MTGVLLALDIGRNLGCALGPTDGSLPAIFTRKLKNTTDLGEWLESADPIIVDLLTRYGVTCVAVEKTNTEASGYYAVRKNMGLQTHIIWHCRKLGFAPPVEIQAQDAKILMTGKGAHFEPDPDRPGKKRGTKQPMVDAALALGYEDATPDEADALGIHRVFVLGAPERSEASKKAKARAKAKRDAKS